MNNNKNNSMLVNDEILEKLGSLRNVKHLSDFNNKLWLCILNNDGSMTIFLKNLFENLQLELVSEKPIEKAENFLLEKLNDFLKIGMNLNHKYIERRINFLSEEKNIMLGISFWDVEFYKKLYENVDKCKPIGVGLIEKEVEMFKQTNSFITTNENKNKNDSPQVYRFTIFKTNKMIAGVLLEVFETIFFKEVFGNCYVS